MNPTALKRATAAAGSAGLIAATFGLIALAPTANAADPTVSADVTVSVSASTSTGTTAAEITTTAAATTTTATSTSAAATSTASCLSADADIRAALSYTFNAATGAGVITLAGTKPLCSPLYVRPTSWEFDNGASMWPQHLVGFTDFTVQAVNSYPFTVPARGCGQSDIYASFWFNNLTALPTTLTGPGAPYEPAFIGQWAAVYGIPWSQDSVPCTTPTPTPTTSAPSTSASTPPETTSTSPSVSVSGTTSTSPSETTSTSPSVSVSGTTSTSPVPSVSGTTTTNTTPPVTTATSPGATVSGISETNTPTSTATPVTPPSVLPFTGSNVGSIALFGALGILAGLALMVATRKPRRQ